MDELLQAVLNDDFVSFNEKFKEKLQDKHTTNVNIINAELGKTIISEMQINDGRKKLKCKNCGEEYIPGIPVMGSCPKCGALQ